MKPKNDGISRRNIGVTILFYQILNERMWV